MPTITAPAPWDLPTGTTPPLDMLGTYYGVPISDIGEDGDVIALGHVGTHRMAAALRRHAREVWGDDIADPMPTSRRSLTDITDAIAHVWMVNTVDDLDEWCLERTEPTTPGAFPVTYWTA
ncbi:hypothetical protein ABZ738_05575 [Micromonospora sp. NPDC047793]|uniref:hypothetical protein n=1 Tax=Micromonospora sp. NPDC047793 TaxID=3154342 RepID=UPI003402A94B